MAELKPCPFCGGEATISDGGHSGERFLVRCRESSCPAVFGTVRKSRDEAIAAWNRRISTECSIGCGICLAHNDMKCPRMENAKND